MTAKLETLAMAVQGKRYGDKGAEATLKTADWNGYYPVVDNSMCYTGEVVEASESGTIIDDAVMVI